MKNSISKVIVATALVTLPIAAAAQDWDGLYGGVTLGYANHNASHSYSNAAPTLSSDPDGALYGAFMGYAVQSGQTVFGGEIDFEGSSVSGSKVNLTGATSGGKAELNWQGSIRGVLGYAGTLGARPALFYGTLGWAYSDYDFKGGPSATFLANGYSDSLDGWTIGLGIDTRLANDWSLRTEYRYTDYGTANGRLQPGFPGVSMPVSVEQHAVRVGLRYDF